MLFPHRRSEAKQNGSLPQSGKIDASDVEPFILSSPLIVAPTKMSKRGRFRVIPPSTVTGWFVGSPEEIAEEMRQYVAVGVQLFMLQHYLLDDSDGLEVLAAKVMPAVAG